MGVAPNHLPDTLKRIHEMAQHVRKKTLGSLTPGFRLTDEVYSHLDEILPTDAHILATDRVYISLTRFPFLTNHLQSDFSSRDELIQCLVCSCFIPVYNGLKFPSVRNMVCIDGCYTSNLPVFPDGKTLIVTPFSGENERGISPIDHPDPPLKVHFKHQRFCINYRNMERLVRTLFPPSTATLDRIYQSGFEDALKFLQKEGWTQSVMTR